MTEPVSRALSEPGDTIPVFSVTPHIRRVAMDSPWRWLAEGWTDLRSAARLSLGYGMALVIISVALTITVASVGLIYLVLPLAAGFFMLAPILAVGLYEISRRRDHNLSVRL